MEECSGWVNVNEIYLLIASLSSHLAYFICIILFFILQFGRRKKEVQGIIDYEVEAKLIHKISFIHLSHFYVYLCFVNLQRAPHSCKLWFGMLIHFSPSRFVFASTCSLACSLARGGWL